MPMQISCVKDRHSGKRAVVFQSQDAIDAYEMCKLLKKSFPETYQAVYMEIDVPEGKSFEIPADLNDAHNP